jgi:hypothetical protein
VTQDEIEQALQSISEACDELDSEMADLNEKEK